MQHDKKSLYTYAFWEKWSKARISNSFETYAGVLHNVSTLNFHTELCIYVL